MSIRWLVRCRVNLGAPVQYTHLITPYPRKLLLPGNQSVHYRPDAFLSYPYPLRLSNEGEKK
jgi:hypothetical protein